MNVPRSPSIFLLGGTGQVGHDLLRVLPELGPVVAPGRAELDLADLQAVRDTVRAAGPDLIINAGAWTDVEGAEDDEPGAMRLNSMLPEVLAETARELGAVFVHYSTDYVFGDRSVPIRHPLREDETPLPMNAYGRSKWAGEQAVESVGGRYLILRLSWVYSLRRRNFLKAIAERAKRGEPLRVVDDQIGTPTWSGAIAEATRDVLHRLDAVPSPWGTYHLSSGEACSWADFADDIVAWVQGDEAQPVTRIASSEFATKAARPRYSVLAVDKVENVFGVALPPWREQLRRCVTEGRSE